VPPFYSNPSIVILCHYATRKYQTTLKSSPGTNILAYSTVMPGMKKRVSS
jgi:hypothetical protein